MPTSVIQRDSAVFSEVEIAILNVRQGCVEDYAKIVSAYQERLRRALSATTSGNVDVNEIAHEAFVKAFLHIDSYQPGTDFFAWLKQIARNLLLAELKNRRMTAQKGQNYLAFLMNSTLTADRADAESLDEARIEALEHCLEKLTVRDRSIINLRYRQGASIRDVALMLGKSPGAVKVLLFSIREKLRDCVQRQLSRGAQR